MSGSDQGSLMNACVFAGPTLPPRDAARSLDATWLPPAKHGDVYRAVTLLHPRAIGLVDGYFQWVPSVWHKEILWAIQQGVYVFGAASMGALRAAELAPFGMRGVGRIFEAYRDGMLAGCGDEPFEDDDEVAVVHGPRESSYIAASEAMVNVRCTLAEAHRAGVLTAATHSRLIGIAKALYFPERSYEALLARARAGGLDRTELARLQAWLPEGRVDQKRADARAMLETMRCFMAQDPAPSRPGFTFEHTTLWERAIAGALPATVHDAEEACVLEELRLDAMRWELLRGEVLRPLIASVPAHAAPAPATPAPRAPDRRGEPDEIELVLEQAARRAAVLRLREDLAPAFIERLMLARIRGSEEFERLRARAADKRTRLTARRDLPEAGDFSDLQLLELRDWYFSRVLERDMPDDIEQCVAAWGYADLAHFHRALFAEYVYRQMSGPAAAEQAGGVA